MITLDPTVVHTLLESQKSTHGLLRFRAVSEHHEGVGFVTVIPPKGLSVISDIDDTIKITQIPEGERMVLMNTFFKDFIAAPCMAEMYTALGQSTAFHYVSGGPWQMYRPLYDFLFSETAGFPRGSFHMKNARMNPFESESYKDLWTLISNGSQLATIDQKHRQIQTEFPSQIREIRIRVVPGTRVEPDRLAGMTLIPPDIEAGKTCSDFITQISGGGPP